MDALSAFLALSPGREECAPWLSDWYVAVTGKPDPAAHLRRGERSHAELAREARRLARALGLARTAQPRRGDVGLISLIKGHLVGAIFTGTHWCVLSDNRGIGGVLPQCCRFVAAWRLA